MGVVEELFEFGDGIVLGDQQEDVVSEDSWMGTLLVDHPGPWEEKEGDECHGKGATLWDRGGLGVGRTKGSSDAIVGKDLLVVGTVGLEYPEGDAGPDGEGVQEAAVYLIETFHDVHGSSGEGRTGDTKMF